MWRYLAGAGAGALLVMAGMMLQAMRPGASAPLAAMPAVAMGEADQSAGSIAVPEASAKTREEKRFNRYDKDRNGTITRDEYLASRRKAYARLDVDGNGTLSFDEWATKAEAKFATADKDKSGAMNAVEFATTAVKRKTPVRSKCPPEKAATAAPAASDGKEDDT